MLTFVILSVQTTLTPWIYRSIVNYVPRGTRPSYGTLVYF